MNSSPLKRAPASFLLGTRTNRLCTASLERYRKFTSRDRVWSVLFFAGVFSKSSKKPEKEARILEVLCELREPTQFSPWDKREASLRFHFYITCCAQHTLPPMTRRDSINSGAHPLSVWIAKTNQWLLVSSTVGFDACGRRWVEKFGIGTNKSNI